MLLCTQRTRFCPVPPLHHLLIGIPFCCCVVFIRYWEMRVDIFQFWFQNITSLCYRPCICNMPLKLLGIHFTTGNQIVPSANLTRTKAFVSHACAFGARCLVRKQYKTKSLTKTNISPAISFHRVFMVYCCILLFTTYEPEMKSTRIQFVT